MDSHLRQPLNLPGRIHIPEHPELTKWLGELHNALNQFYYVLRFRIDSEIFQGLLSQRPEAMGWGRFFFATDTDQLFYDKDRGTWVEVAGGSGAPADATFITQTPNGSLSAEQALNALTNGLLKHTSGVVARAVPGTDYSAPGHAHGSIFLAADYASLQAAIDACAAAGGGMVVADAVTYSENITISGSYINLVGQGFKTIIDSGGLGHGITVTGHFCSICDLQINGVTGSGNHDAINCTGNRLRVENVHVNAHGRYGIYFGTQGRANVSRCMIVTDSSALYLDANNVVVFGNHLYAPQVAAVRSVVVNSGYNVISGNVIFQGNPNALWLTASSTRCAVVGNWLQGGSTNNGSSNIVGNNAT